MNQSESSLYNSFSGKAQLKITGVASPLLVRVPLRLTATRGRTATLDRRDKYRPRKSNGELARSWGFPP